MRRFAGVLSVLVLSFSVPAMAAEMAPASNAAGATLSIAGHSLPLVNFDLGLNMSISEIDNGGLKQNHVQKVATGMKGGHATVMVTSATLASLRSLAGNGQSGQTWIVQLAGVQWTLTGARMGSVDTPKDGGASTVHVSYETMSVGNAVADPSSGAPAPMPAAYSDTLTFDGGEAGFSSAKSSGTGPVTITLLRGVSSSAALFAHIQQKDSFDADLTVNGTTEHLENARITAYQAGSLNATGTDMAIEQLTLVADSATQQSRHAAAISRVEPAAFTTAADAHDADGCKDGTLPRLKTYYLNDCDPAQADSYNFAADTSASQDVSGTKVRLAYAIDENATVPDAQAVLDDYSALLKQRGWTITHEDNLSITAHTSDAHWAEVSVNGGGNYQIVYVSP